MFIPHYVSHVTCHVSPVTCHVSFKKIGQSGGASRWRVCYQRGLPRLVFKAAELLNRYFSYLSCRAKQLIASTGCYLAEGAVSLMVPGKAVSLSVTKVFHMGAGGPVSLLMPGGKLLTDPV